MHSKIQNIIARSNVSKSYFLSNFYLAKRSLKPNETFTMGAKTPANVEENRLVSCDICQASFPTARSLKSHTLAKHPSDTKMSLNKAEKKTASVPPTSRVSKRLQDRKQSSDKTKMTATKPQKIAETRRPLFECPKCLKLFPVYFSALKHVQKRHSNDLDENEPLDIKPTEVELCTECDERIVEDNHVCVKLKEDTPPSDNGEYSCLGCDKVFPTINAFDQHVSKVHNVNVDMLIFNDMNEFKQWKSSLENHVRVKYQTLSNTRVRQYYQCNYVSPKNSAHMTHLCPSVVVARQNENGVLVYYYKNHHSHICPEYEVPKKFISNVSSEPSNDEIFDSLLPNEEQNDNEQYKKFKELMQRILIRSEKLDVDNIVKLHSLALDMEKIMDSVLNGTEKDDDDDENREEILPEATESTKVSDSPANKSMTDDQITKVLEIPKSSRVSERLKRKSESSQNDAKKKKVGPKSASTNTSLKENNSNAKEISDLKPVISSPSFNDSYKEFIGTTVTKTTPPNSKIQPKSPTNTRKSSNRREVMKTKIGQFIPSPEKQKKDNSENVATKKKSKVRSPRKSIKDLNLEDIDYEIVEQENDCNILVLKI